jgi:hypothetical protein
MWAEEAGATMEELDKAAVLLSMYQRKSEEWNAMDGEYSGLGLLPGLLKKGVDGS